MFTGFYEMKLMTVSDLYLQEVSPDKGKHSDSQFWTCCYKMYTFINIWLIKISYGK